MTTRRSFFSTCAAAIAGLFGFGKVAFDLDRNKTFGDLIREGKMKFPAPQTTWVDFSSLPSTDVNLDDCKGSCTYAEVLQKKEFWMK